MVAWKCIPFSPAITIFDAKVMSASAAVEESLLLPSARFANNLWILLDNQDIARHLLSTPISSSQRYFLKFLKQASSWPLRRRLTHTKQEKVRVFRIPVHAGIQGNVLVNLTAKEALGLTPPPSQRFSFKYARNWTNETTESETKHFWTNYAPQSYKNLRIDRFERRPKELSLPRSLVAHIYAARSGHGDFAAYHKRSKHQEALTVYSCGSPKSPSHIFFCPRLRHALPRNLSNTGEISNFFLDTLRGARSLVKWLVDTKVFIEICPKASGSNIP